VEGEEETWIPRPRRIRRDSLVWIRRVRRYRRERQRGRRSGRGAAEERNESMGERKVEVCKTWSA